MSLEAAFSPAPDTATRAPATAWSSKDFTVTVTVVVVPCSRMPGDTVVLDRLAGMLIDCAGVGWPRLPSPSCERTRQ